MVVFESHEVRWIVGRLGRGERIHEALVTLARERHVTSGWVSALGAFEWVELCEYDQSGRRYREARRFDAPCEILSLVGNLSFRAGAPFAHLHVTLSRETDGAVEVLGGHLVDGQVFACELRLECWDDLVLGREPDVATGLSLWTPAPPGAVASPGTGVAGGATAAPSSGSFAGPASAASSRSGAPSSGVSWAQVAEASARPPLPSSTGKAGEPGRRRPGSPVQAAPVPAPLPPRRREAPSEPPEEPGPEKGDWIEHAVFGLCRVEGEDGRGNLIIRLPSRARKAINLDVMRVLPSRVEGDRHIFPLRPRKRR